MLKRTPLFETHQKLGGRLIEFGGWEMPVQYSSIIEEHEAVRTAAGLFDISHMGEIQVRGPQSAQFLNYVLTNNIHLLHVGQAQYSLMCNEKGGVIDDLYVYRLEEDTYWLVVNASRAEADFAWLQKQVKSFGDAALENISGQISALAVQGPAVVQFIDQCFPGKPSPGSAVEKPGELRKNQAFQLEWKGFPIRIARTGYTGEDGFEVLAPNEAIQAVWNGLMESGASHGIKPAGLGARDTLRTEVCYPLYGHELDEETTPIEAGLGFFVALDKPDFIGRSALAEQKLKGPAKKCVAFRMMDKSAPPRPQYLIWSKNFSEKAVGKVVSGTQSPTLGVGIGLGYVPAELARPGNSIEVEIRGRRFPAQIVAKPIYRKNS